MKKMINILLAVFVLCNVCILPVRAYSEIDYSSYIGDWSWKSDLAGEDRFSLGSADLKITECTSSYVDFTFSVVAYHFFDEINGYRVPIVNNTAALTAQGINNRSWTVTLTFNNDGIWFETDVKNNGHGQLTKPEFQLIMHDIAEDNINVMFNGKVLDFDRQPVMKDDRVMVPIRTVFEEMGAEVYYDVMTAYDIGGDEKIEVITIIKNYTDCVSLSKYSSEDDWYFYTEDLRDYQSRKDIELDVQPIIIDGRTLVPVRAVSEALGGEVIWDGNTKTVKINCPIATDRRSAEEIEQIQQFSLEDAQEYVKRQYVLVDLLYDEPPVQGEYVDSVDHADNFEFDEKGKKYGFFLFSGEKGVIGYLDVYHDGTIIRHMYD